MSHEQPTQGTHDDLGVDPLQRIAEVAALESDVNGDSGPLSPSANEGDFDHLGRALPQSDPETPSTVPSSESYRSVVPGASVLRGAFSRIRARRAQAAVEKARLDSEPK